MLFIHFLQLVQIVGTLRIYTFMNEDVFPVFLMHKVVLTMRAL